ncbi:MAG: branched-chain amino acid ABC transporter permease [Acidimicrobiia bacterium]
MRQSRLGSVLILLAVALLWPTVGSAVGGDEPETPTTTTGPDGEAQAFEGTLIEAGEPVEGVTIGVEALDGEEIGAAESGAGGRWRVPVSVPGRYRVTIDTDTLPDGVDLTDRDATTFETDIFPGRPTVVLFALGERAGGGPNDFERLAQSTTNGLKFGLIIAMSAIGLSLIFGTTGLINFAHGELVTLGAVIAWFLNARGPLWSLLVASLVSVAICGLFGGALERGVWRPLRIRQVGLFQGFVITIGLSLIIRHILLIWFGGQRRGYLDYRIQNQWELGPVSITPRDLAIMAMAALILIGVATVLQRTRMGKATRAVSDNVDLSEASGIDVQRVILVVWIAGAALAAIGGIFLGAIESVDWQMGTRMLLLMFAAVILGGLGTAYGAMVGGIIVGLVTEISTIWVPSALKLVFALGALVLALLVRPQGILGRAERIG